MVDFFDFFRLFDFLTWGGGSKWSILLNFFDFSTFRPGGRVQMFGIIIFFRLFDFSTWAEGPIVDFIDFFRLFDQEGRV